MTKIEKIANKTPKVSVPAVICILAALAIGVVIGQKSGTNREPTLPAPELSEGQRGELGIDKNLNENNIDQYLGRKDSVYRDMRMLKDPAEYERIGGDSYLSGLVRGFEVVPYPYLATVEGLPEAVGKAYSGKTLFTIKDDEYIANYEESMQILEDLFPKDKNIFLMCGGGGYAGMTKKMLVKLGWNENKIYVVGGYWYYEGENKIEIKETASDGKTTYAFWKIPYHEIDFQSLKEQRGEIKNISKAEYEKMISEKKSFMTFVDMTNCITADGLRKSLNEIAKDYKMTFYRVMWDDMKDSSLRETIKYYPSVAIIKDGEIKEYLKADSDEDKEEYNSKDSLKNWLFNML